MTTAVLRGKRLVGAEVLDTAEQLLEDTVAGAGGVAGQLVAGELDLVVGDAALVAPLANNPGLAETTTVVLLVEGDIELLVLGVLAEALVAVPGGVLQGEEGAVGREDVVEAADADDGVVGVLDDAAEGVVLGGRQRRVPAGAGVAADEDLLGRALVPVDVGRVDGVLDVGAVEVDLGALGIKVTLELQASVNHVFFGVFRENF